MHSPEVIPQPSVEKDTNMNVTKKDTTNLGREETHGCEKCSKHSEILRRQSKSNRKRLSVTTLGRRVSNNTWGKFWAVSVAVLQLCS